MCEYGVGSGDRKDAVEGERPDGNEVFTTVGVLGHDFQLVGACSESRGEDEQLAGEIVHDVVIGNFRASAVYGVHEVNPDTFIGPIHLDLAAHNAQVATRSDPVINALSGDVRDLQDLGTSICHTLDLNSHIAQFLAHAVTLIELKKHGVFLSIEGVGSAALNDSVCRAENRYPSESAKPISYINAC